MRNWALNVIILACVCLSLCVCVYCTVYRPRNNCYIICYKLLMGLPVIFCSTLAALMYVYIMSDNVLLLLWCSWVLLHFAYLVVLGI